MPIGSSQGSASGAQKLLDRPENRLAVGDAAGDHVLAFAEQLVDVLEELAAAVGALHLPVTEQVQPRQQFLRQDLDAVRDVVAPVVAVGEVEGVNVPLIRRILCGDDLVGQRVGRTDLRAARLARVVERVLIHQMSHRIMHNVDVLDALVVRLEPGIDPECLDAHDLLLLVGHRAGYVHHVDDARDALGLVNFLPAAVLLIRTNRQDNRLFGVVSAAGNLPLEGALESTLEVSQRFGACLTNAGVLVLGGDDVLLAARFDPRQGQFLAQNLREFLQRQFHFEDVAARLIAGAALVALRCRQGVARLALALADAAGAFLTVAELRQVDLRQGDADEILALLADQLAAADVFSQVCLHLAPDDLPEALVIAFNLLPHGRLPSKRKKEKGKRKKEKGRASYPERPSRASFCSLRHYTGKNGAAGSTFSYFVLCPFFLLPCPFA